MATEWKNEAGLLNCFLKYLVSNLQPSLGSDCRSTHLNLNGELEDEVSDDSKWLDKTLILRLGCPTLTSLGC